MLSLVGCWKKEPRPEPFTTLTVDYISHIAHLVESYHIRTQPTQRWGRHSWSIIDIWFRGDAMLIFVLLPSYFYSNADAICCNFSEHDSLSLKQYIVLYSFLSVSVNLPRGLLQIRATRMVQALQDLLDSDGSAGGKKGKINLFDSETAVRMPRPPTPAASKCQPQTRTLTLWRLTRRDFSYSNKGLDSRSSAWSTINHHGTAHPGGYWPH